MNSSDNPIKKEKRNKLKQLFNFSVNPYPHNYKKQHSLAKVAEKEKPIQPGEDSSQAYTVAGRILLKRDMGKAAFFNIRDESGDLQCYIRKEDFKSSFLKENQTNKNSSQKENTPSHSSDREMKIPPSSWDLWKLSDIGDIVGLTGPVFRTRKGELSLRVKDYQMLCKSLEPLPEKYHGLEDVELKYRYRHLDLIMNPRSRKTFRIRSKIIQEIRSFMNQKGFMEVETPILQPVYGGAVAEPFITKHLRLKRNLYLKISPEMYLKKLLVGGFEKVYEIGKNFRNEGIDRTHNPEFTMMEYYEAYTDYEDQMKQFKELICHVTQKIKGSLKFSYQGRELDFNKWERLSVKEGILKYGGFNVDKINVLELKNKILSLDSQAEPVTSFDQFVSEIKVSYNEPPSDDFILQYLEEPDHKERADELKDEMIMAAFELTAEKKFKEEYWNPVFITDFPLGVSPLTKKHRKWKENGESKYSRTVERFEPYIAGMEMGNAYTELNDPLEQKKRLKQQERKDNHPVDENFLHALEVGMPPVGGVGLGIERLVMILTDEKSIKDSLLFPILKSDP